MFRISREFKFAASHQIEMLPDDHKCRRLHGHNYKVQLVLESSDLDSNGFVKDYGELKEFKAEVDRLDHRHLNDFSFLHTTSAENIALHFWGVAESVYNSPSTTRRVRVCKIRVSEGEKTWSEYSRE